MGLGIELRVVVAAEIGSTSAREFQKAMKENHKLAMEYIAWLLNRTIAGNSPLLRNDIDKWLKRDAVAEFQGFQFPVAKIPGVPGRPSPNHAPNSGQDGALRMVTERDGRGWLERRRARYSSIASASSAQPPTTHGKSAWRGPIIRP
jgi:hypothetical protein